MSEETAHHFDTVISRLEKLGKLLVTVLMLVMSGAVWAATLELRVRSMETEQRQMRPELEIHGRQISNMEGRLMEGRLHGISSQIGKMPSKVAAKLSATECSD